MYVISLFNEVYHTYQLLAFSRISRHVDKYQYLGEFTSM